MITPVRCCHCNRGVEIEGVIISKERLDDIRLLLKFDHAFDHELIVKLREYIEGKY